MLIVWRVVFPGVVLVLGTITGVMLMVPQVQKAHDAGFKKGFRAAH